MDIIYNYLAMLVGAGSLFDDLDHCLTPFDLACKSRFKKLQFASGNKGNTKRSLASELGILTLASDPCFQWFSVENSHVRGAGPQLGLTNWQAGSALAFPRLQCTPDCSSAWKGGAFSSFPLSKKGALVGII